ncbi:hypothetical protein [Solibacillus sp. CAU 1738]|uniref:hypothetical protein n=1 Tax=Solibacillus sp. CAU 1738 TaxID=3140363 RepID=UPI00326195DF
MKMQIQKWNLAFVAVSTVIGGLLGQTIIYSIKGEFSFSVILGFLTGATILIVINIIKIYLKKDKTPDIDERTRNNVLNFLVFSSNIFLGLLFVALSIISIIGMESIAIKNLWIIMIAYLWIIGIGAFIVRRR